MRVIRTDEREGKGREGRGGEGKGGEGRKQEEDDLAPPQKKFLDPPRGATTAGVGGGGGVRTPQILLGPLQLFSWGSNLGGVRRLREIALCCDALRLRLRVTLR
jgi:hypothetical protein